MSRIRLAAVVAGATVLLLSAIGLTAAAGPPGPDEGLTPIQQLGKSIFFDERLSANGNQSCASCHDPRVGFTGPQSETNLDGAVYEGSVPGSFGNRKPPTSAYISMGPVLYQDKTDTWVGGAFWDGRATGWTLGSPTAEQALGPFLNPKEQALASSAEVVALVCTADYAVSFEAVWGLGACASPDAYADIGRSIAAYEASAEVNPFSSQWDLSFGGTAKLTAQERQGMAIFNGRGGCKACHPGGKGGLFTDFTYDNLGVPRNPENPVYHDDPGFVDEGLGGFLQTVPGVSEDEWSEELGKQKVPTLRNVDKRPTLDTIKAYMHNGYFKTLEGVVHFYNTRDVLPTCPGEYTEAQAMAAACWPAPEVAQTVNHDELGDLGLSPADEAALVAYLKTLSDGWTP